MMKKQRTHFLIISDDAASHTGFGRVVHNLAGNIVNKAQDYIVCRTIALNPVGADVPRVVPTMMAIRKPNDYGEETFDAYVTRYGMPDIIFLLGDWWYWKDSFLNPAMRRARNIWSSIWFYAPVDGIQMSSVARAAYQGADVLFAMSPFGMQELRGYTGKEPVLLPHGYDDRVYKYARHEYNGKITWGVVSRNGPRKNIALIIQAHNSLPEKYRGELLLHVARTDESGGNLAAFIHRFGFKHCRYTDAVNVTVNQKAKCSTITGLPEDEMCALYQRIHCLVSAGREGFGLPYLEARVCGCRLVIPEYSGHYSMNYSGAQTYPIHHYAPTATAPDIMDPVISVDELRGAMLHVGRQIAGEAPLGMYEMAQTMTWDAISDELISAIRMHGVHPQGKMAAELQHCRSNDVEIEKKVLVTMPGSHGDVMLMTAVADGLRKKHPGHEIVFATSRKYFEILRDCPSVDRIVDYVPEIDANFGLLQRQYEAVYTPHHETQRSGNWVHGGHCRSLAEVYANHCGVELGNYHTPNDYVKVSTDTYITLHVGSGTGEQSARKYERWDAIVAGLRDTISIFQIGGPDDMPVNGTVDMRGKLTIRQMYGILNKAALHIGIDSFPMHAACVQKTRCLILWGNTFPHATGPATEYREWMTPIRGTPIHPCARPCHNVECRYKIGCINNIMPEAVVSVAKGMLA